MDEHALEVLEFPSLLRLIGGYTSTVSGLAAVQSLRPSTVKKAVTAKHGLYTDVIGLLAGNAQLPSLAFEDVSDILRRAAPEGAVLGGEDLLLVRALLQQVSAVQEFLRSEVCRQREHLRTMGGRLQTCADVFGKLKRALDKEGGLQDTASDHLLRLRRKARRLQDNIQHVLEGILRDPRFSEALQEKFITVRNGRFVIPVRRESKSAVSGVVHDHSSSGQTVFVEPTMTLPAGNELADIRLEERDECRRILAELTGTVREKTGELKENQFVLTEFDAAFGIGRWAQIFDCALPAFGEQLDLRHARHPLLLGQFLAAGQHAEVVPLDLNIPADTRVLVITGSNSGGKTVALKTAGLLTLAAQAGLPVPVSARSRFVLFDQVFADIGDEQSLEANLSTFSAHMAHLTSVLRNIEHTKRSLVLLDELGAGTDPLEGGALACAVLAKLASCQALTLATTHLGIVKTFVQEQKRMLNAAVRFNLETLAPEYALDIGRPGASHALNIAQRFGVPEGVLDTARKLLSTDHLRLEGMLSQMADSQRLLAIREKEVEQARTEVVRDRDEIQAELNKLRRERRKLLHEAYQQASGIVDNARRRMEHLLGQIQQASPLPRTSAEHVAKTARKILSERSRKLDKAVKQTAPRPAQPIDPRQLRVGETVRVEKLQELGRILTLDASRSRAEVDVGGVRFTVAYHDLGKPTALEQAAEATSRVLVSVPRPRGRTPHEINLVGLHVDEALLALDRFVDQARLARLDSIRIVHGFGTGRLCQAVHEWLERHAGIESFTLGKHGEDPGGGGVTMAKLAQ